MEVPFKHPNCLGSILSLMSLINYLATNSSSTLARCICIYRFGSNGSWLLNNDAACKKDQRYCTLEFANG